MSLTAGWEMVRFLPEKRPLLSPHDWVLVPGLAALVLPLRKTAHSHIHAAGPSAGLGTPSRTDCHGPSGLSFRYKDGAPEANPMHRPVGWQWMLVNWGAEVVAQVPPPSRVV